jgi:hypothetical protein
VSADRFGAELELIARHTADPAVYRCVLDVAPRDRDAEPAGSL